MQALRAPAIQREMLTDSLWEEVAPLLARHWQEIAHYRDIPLKPDRARYDKLQLAGMLRVWTARLDHELVGYLCVIVSPHLHYADSLVASQDVFYVAREHRGAHLGRLMLEVAEASLRRDGVQIMVQHTKADPSISIERYLQRLGYERMDVLMVKRLDRE